MKIFKDYYKILQVDPLADFIIIEAAFRKLSYKYHPDRNKDPGAEEKYKEITEAHSVLKDPIKRKEYNKAYNNENDKDSSEQEYSDYHEPKPEVDNPRIIFRDAKPGEIRKASFIINNVGGNFKVADIFCRDPNSFVEIVSILSLGQDEELPARVEIEVTGREWNKSYSETIIISLDGVETEVYIELNTMQEPIEIPDDDKKHVQVTGIKKVVGIIFGALAIIIGLGSLIFGFINFWDYGWLIIAGVIILSYSIYSFIITKSFSQYPNLLSKILTGFTMATGGFISIFFGIYVICGLIFAAVAMLALFSFFAKN